MQFQALNEYNTCCWVLELHIFLWIYYNKLRTKYFLIVIWSLEKASSPFSIEKTILVCCNFHPPNKTLYLYLSIHTQRHFPLKPLCTWSSNFESLALFLIVSIKNSLSKFSSLVKTPKLAQEAWVCPRLETHKLTICTTPFLMTNFCYCSQNDSSAGWSNFVVQSLQLSVGNQASSALSCPCATLGENWLS